MSSTATKTFERILGEVLLRGVTKRHVDENGPELTPTADAFNTSSNDAGLFSVDRETIRTAQDTFNARIAAGSSTVGVIGIHCSEATAVNLPTYASEEADNAAHAHLDFNALSESKDRKLAREVLAKHASNRGWLFRP
jgi:hypothetical protein